MTNRTSIPIRHADMGDYEYLAMKDPHVAPADLKKMIEDQKALVVEDNGCVVGCLRYSLFWDTTPFMNFLWIEEQCRGKGLGTALVMSWETELAGRGYRRVMTSSQSNEQGQHLYRKLGYKDFGGFTLPGESLEIMFFKDIGD